MSGQIEKAARFDMTKPAGNWKTIQGIFESETVQGELAKVASKFLTPQKLARFALTALRTSQAADKLMRCTGQSLCKSLMDCAELGLIPTTAMGQGYFVPYGSECQFQVGYRGFIELARRSGQVTHIAAHVVRDGDRFEYDNGTGYITHRPTGDTNTDITHFFAIAFLKGTDGPHPWTVMSKDEVDKHRDRYSKAYQFDKRGGSPWSTAYEEMAKKTVIRRLCKYLSLSPELTQATILDEYNEAGVGAKQVQAEDVTAGRKTFAKAFSTPEPQEEQPSDAVSEAPADGGGAHDRAAPPPIAPAPLPDSSDVPDDPDPFFPGDEPEEEPAPPDDAEQLVAGIRDMIEAGSVSAKAVRDVCKKHFGKALTGAEMAHADPSKVADVFADVSAIAKAKS